MSEKRGGRFKPLSGLLADIVNEAVPDDPLERRRIVERIFSEFLGPVIAQHCRISRFEKGVLNVVVSDPDWRRELSGFRTRYMAEINRRLPRVLQLDEIRFSG